MAIKNEAFLVLEFSLAQRLDTATKKEYLPKIRRAASDAIKGDFVSAHEEVNSINLTEAVESERKFIDLVGMQAILFGARDFHSAKNTSFAGNPPPVELKNATDTITKMLIQNTTEAVKSNAHNLLDIEQVAQNESEIVIQKATTKGFVRNFVSSVGKKGRGFVDIGSSLHTSRLASWGFTTEAELLGQTSFIVSEVLDGRTCPVCNLMNGKVFPVNTAKLRLESQLSINDPLELKAVAKWPSQTKSGIAKLESMSDSELISAGWDTPPYHPRCRGVLRRTNKIAPLTIPETVLPLAVEEIITPLVVEAASLGGVASVASVAIITESTLPPPVSEENEN